MRTPGGGRGNHTKNFRVDYTIIFNFGSSPVNRKCASRIFGALSSERSSAGQTISKYFVKESSGQMLSVVWPGRMATPVRVGNGPIYFLRVAASCRNATSLFRGEAVALLPLKIKPPTTRGGIVRGSRQR